MGRNRKVTLASGPAATGAIDFKPLSGDSNPLNGVTVKGPDSVGASPLAITLPSAVVNNGVVRSNGSGVLDVNLIQDVNIDAAAAIALTKLAATTVSRALESDASGLISPSAVTSVELGYVSGVTSAIQTQLDAKQTTTLADANILIGSAGNVATANAVTGDVSLSNAGVTAYVGTLPLNKGGTGQTTQAPAFDALSPMTTSGDMIYGGVSGTGTRLPKGTDGDFLSLVSGAPAWTALSTVITPWDNSLVFSVSGLGSVTNLEVWSRRVGDTMEVRGTCIAGSPGSSPILVGLPTSYNIDTTKMTTRSSVAGVGMMHMFVPSSGALDIWFPTSGNFQTASLFFDGTDTDLVMAAYQSNSSAEYNPVNGNALVAPSCNINFTFSIPIAGW